VGTEVAERTTGVQLDHQLTSAQFERVAVGTGIATSRPGFSMMHSSITTVRDTFMMIVGFADELSVNNRLIALGAFGFAVVLIAIAVWAVQELRGDRRVR
jgi:hypothetical protein